MAVTRRRPRSTGLAAAGVLAALALVACGGPDTSPTPVVAGSAGFRATFPGRPRRQGQPANAVTGAVAVQTYVSEVPGGAVGVSSSVLVRTPTTDAATNPVLADAVDGSAQSTGGRVTSSRVITWQGRLAEDAVIATPAATIHERVTVAEGRLFVITGITKSATGSLSGYDLVLGSFRAG